MTPTSDAALVHGSPPREFTLADQQWFAQLSGDANPMHLDPLAARRTQAGRPVVHGVHTLVWALETLAGSDVAATTPSRLRADFLTFLPTGAQACVQLVSRSESGLRATVQSDDVTVMSLELRFGVRASASDGKPASEASPSEPGSAVDLSLSQMADQHGSVSCAADDAAVAGAFPGAAAWLGAHQLNGLLACTRLVGMVCPGLHSIFNRIDATFVTEPAGPGRIAYRVDNVDERFRRVRLAVTGSGLEAVIIASARQPPVAQDSFASLASLVEPDAFSACKALVVGGSRGLGELTAKLLAAGGAEVLVTYATGREDALRVADEIVGGGGKCTALAFHAEGDAEAQLGPHLGGVTHCYYFATSAIFAAPKPRFDRLKFDRFFRLYGEAFERLCITLEALSGSAAITVYYPSSVAVVARPPGMTEYAMAKAAGVILAEEISRTLKRVRVISTQLPRLLTDQTATLFQQESESASTVILDVVRKTQQTV